MGLILKCVNKRRKKKGKNPTPYSSLQLIQCNPVPLKHRDPQLIWKDVIYTQSLPCSCWAETCQHTPCLKLVHELDHFSNQFGISGPLHTWITPDELYGAIWRVILSPFWTSPLLLHLLRRMLQHCFALNLQKYFVDYETSTDLPSSGWGWTDTVIDLYFIFGWTYPLLMHMLKTFTKVSDKESLLTEHINA